MNRYLLNPFGVLLALLFICSAAWSAEPSSIIQRILPSPSSIIVPKEGGVFRFSNTVSVCSIPEADDALSALESRFNTAAGISFTKIRTSSKAEILFKPAGRNDSLGTEGYMLNVSSHRIIITANSREGFFYAVQTILQLLPYQITGSAIRLGIRWEIPAVVIRDVPKYPWRSFMFDSGRQFQTVDFIKHYLDILAQLKINTFHWHLTEGQGWRIEIKRYPKLTAIGSNVAQGAEQQGFYTQDDIKEIVEYARKRCVTVVPEIDLPGHSEAALIAYPEFSCSKRPPASVMEYSSHLFCAGNESTYTFIENILNEVCTLFPARYIHLGGDEAPKTIWDSCNACQAKIRKQGLKNSHELQIYFSNRLANYLKEKNRMCILWGDVVEQAGPKLAENVVIYWWNYRKKQTAAYDAAVANGYSVICGPNYYTYLNFPVTPWSKYDQDRTFDLRDAYEKNPADIPHPSALVLGMGSCLWTDWNVRMSMIDQRVFPRLLVLAEQMWSEKRIPFEKYYANIKEYQYPRLLEQKIVIGPALREEIPEGFRWE
ncbi:MAG: beta-N-acetylhexosaminidase [Bacteroidota bacterium]